MFAGNFGMNTYKVNNSIGFDNSSKNEDINQKEYNNQKERLIDYCKEYFGAEFANRVSEFIPYATLTDENLKMIATLHFESLKKRLEGLYTIQFADNIYDYILSKKTNEHGANASIIDRIIKRDIEEIITSKVIEYKKTENEKLLVNISYDGVKLIGEASSVKISGENKNEEVKEDSKEENNENKKQRTKTKQNNEK
jgi:ATP-dependent Clp protease ATP-binding subunit ClpA